MTLEPMNHSFYRFLSLGVMLSGCLVFTGCLNLEPVQDSVRYFVLTGLPESVAGASEKTSHLGVGVGPVSLAAYLENNRLAVRRTDHEIAYADNRLWAERPAQSIPRVLALTLAHFLGSDRIQSTSWSREDVTFELHVTVYRFEWNTTGQATLEAQWQLRRPGAESMLASGFTQLQGDGPSLSKAPDEAVATLNELLIQMGRQIASKIQTLADTK